MSLLHHRVVLLPLKTGFQPAGEIRQLHAFRSLLELADQVSGIAADGKIRVKAVLLKLLRIDIVQDLVRVRCPVLMIKPGLEKALTASQRQQEVTGLHGKIAGPVPRGPVSSHIIRKICFHRVHTAHSVHHRNAPGLDEPSRRGRGAGKSHAISQIDQRPFCRQKPRDDGFDLRLRNLCHLFFFLEGRKLLRIYHGRLYIQRNIQPAGAGSSFPRKVIRFLQASPDVLRLPDQLAVFCHISHAADYIKFLDSPCPQLQAGGVDGGGISCLSGKHQHGDRIHPCAGNAGDGVGRSRTCGDTDDGHFIVYPRIPLRGHGAGLLVVLVQTVHAGVMAQRIIQIHGASAIYQKTICNPLLYQPICDIIRYSGFHSCSQDLSVFHFPDMETLHTA